MTDSCSTCAASTEDIEKRFLALMMTNLNSWETARLRALARKLPHGLP